MAANAAQDEQRLALFIDFENIAIGVRDARYPKFDVNLVLERLLEKGKILAKKAYADWNRYNDYKRAFHEAAIELIEVPQKSMGGKNSADIRMVVDAMDMSFQKEHINCFVIASGDSDFSPLVSKLKENNKYVIGLGVKNSTSDLLMDNCDEFIFYEDLVRGQRLPLPVIPNVPEKVQECLGLLVDAIVALQRENKEVLWGSMVKETMKRKKPSFNETYYGYRSFSHLLEDAQRRNIVTLRRDQRSGSYVIEDLASAGMGALGSGPVRADATGGGPGVGPAPRPAAPPQTNGGGATNGSAAASSTPAESRPGATETSDSGQRGSSRGRGRGRGGRGRGGRGRGTGAPGAAASAATASDASAGSVAVDDERDFEVHSEAPDDDAAPMSADRQDDRGDRGPEPDPLPARTPDPDARHDFSLLSWFRGDRQKT